MQKKFLTAIILASLSGSLMAKTVATVNGDKIDSSTVDTVISNLRQSNSQLEDSPQLRQEVTRRLAVSTVIAQEAKRLKLDQTPEFKQASEQARASAKQQGADKRSSFKQEWALFQTDLLNRAYTANVAAKNPISDADTQKAYQQMSAYYKGSQEVQLGEILTRNEPDAQKAINDLKSKQSFKTVAEKYTINPQAKQTGGIAPGFVPLKDLEQTDPAIYAAIKDLKKGSYTQPIRSNDGAVYAIFYINEKRNVQVPSYDKMKPELAAQLQQANIAQAVDGLLKNANVKPAN